MAWLAGGGDGEMGRRGDGREGKAGRIHSLQSRQGINSLYPRDDEKDLTSLISLILSLSPSPHPLPYHL